MPWLFTHQWDSHLLNDAMTDTEARREVDAAAYEALGVLLVLHERGLIPEVARERIDAIVAKYRTALPFVESDESKVEEAGLRE
jgi:hypothetical protein